MKSLTKYSFFSILTLIFFSCNEISQKPPNIIIFLTDDQGWGDLSINGNKDLNTPNIDKISREGTRFDRFFVSPVCSPTRAEILTARHHVRTGVYDVSKGGERIDVDEETIADVFKKAGYDTAAYGKWHNGMQAPYHPNTRGFNDFYGFCSGHWGNYFNPILERNGEIRRGKGYIIDDFTNYGIEFIKKNKNNPFLLYLPYNTPHSPMQVPDENWIKFKDKDIIQKGTKTKIDMDKAFGTNASKGPDHTRAALAMCENIDMNVGRIVNTLENLNIDNNTIIIYLSDNGPNGHRWNGQMKGIKGSTDEGGVRSPMTIYWKGTIPEGKIIKQIASGIDILPTLKDFAGINSKPKNKLDGVSLKPIIMGDKITWPERIFHHYWRGKLSLRSQNYRLDNENKLFNMVKDPNQLEDVSNIETDVFKKMLDEKKRWKKEVLSELNDSVKRPFIIGDLSMKYTQIPARDATPNGKIIRSNRYPNCSFLTNWVDLNDTITWEVEVPDQGNFEVEVYYTCAEDSKGSIIELSFLNEKISKEISLFHDPEEYGSDDDRSERIESYVKDFIPLKLGVLNLKKGKGTLTLKGLKKNGKELIDFRLIMLKRI